MTLRRPRPPALAAILVAVTVVALAGPGLVAQPADAAPRDPSRAEREAPEAPTDARSLLASLATVQGLEAKFVERKQLALLRAPLVSEGRLYYTRPGYMARLVDKPDVSKVRIGPTSLEVTDSRGTQAFDLSGRPDIKTFVESFVHVVAGDHDALASIYSLGFEAPSEPGQPWLLTLTPYRKPLSELITRLEIRGRGFAVETIRILEARGDSTEIEMTSVDPKRTFTAEERRELFGLSEEG